MSISGKKLLAYILLSFFFSPFIIAIYGIFSPTTAYATTPGEEVTDSQTSPESSQDASQEVVQEDASPELAQNSLDEASTAVATAESELASTEQTLQEATLDEQEVTNAETQQALSNANEAVEAADSAIQEADTAIADAEQKVSDWSEAQDAVQAQEQEVSAKEVILAEAETALAEATPDYEEAVSVTEDLNDGTANDFTIVVSGGGSVSSTPQNNISLQNINQGTTGVSLNMQYPTADVVITPVTNESVVELGFDYYALNGNAEAVWTYTDGSSSYQTTTTIYDSVSGNQANGYINSHSYLAPSGTTIQNVVIKAAPDWWTLDNIFFSYIQYVMDPQYQQAVDTASSELSSAESTLASYEEIETNKATIANAAVLSAESLVSTAQELVEVAVDKVNVFSSLVSNLLDQAKPAPKPESPKPEKVIPASLELSEEVQLESFPYDEPPLEAVKEETTEEDPKTQGTQSEESGLPEKTVPSLDSTIDDKINYVLDTIETGDSVSLEELEEIGLELEDLPEDTPIAVRTDNEGNEVVITAKDAVAIEIFSSAENLFEELAENPAAVVAALASVGKDMTPEEREESQQVIVASVIVTQVAQVAGAAAASAANSNTSRRR